MHTLLDQNIELDPNTLSAVTDMMFVPFSEKGIYAMILN
ncbi:hypothetical protein ECTPHS_00160 [Ectothiorhodospira sp. PHS-1]|nr:hypothetical protein ECTPHS_00160 [Ectothiorhodospira sp. PHS-1]